MIHTTYWPTNLQVKVFAQLPFGNQLFWFRETFLANQVGSSKILGAMATKMVATWRVDQACRSRWQWLKMDQEVNKNEKRTRPISSQLDRAASMKDLLYSQKQNKMGLSCPLMQPIRKQDQLHLACLWILPYTNTKNKARELIIALNQSRSMSLFLQRNGE